MGGQQLVPLGVGPYQEVAYLIGGKDCGTSLQGHIVRCQGGCILPLEGVFHFVGEVVKIGSVVDHGG